jgi:hypothetical protein
VQVEQKEEEVREEEEVEEEEKGESRRGRRGKMRRRRGKTRGGGSRGETWGRHSWGRKKRKRRKEKIRNKSRRRSLGFGVSFISLLLELGGRSACQKQFLELACAPVDRSMLGACFYSPTGCKVLIGMLACFPACPGMANNRDPPALGT